MTGRQKVLVTCFLLILVLVGVVVIHHYRVKGAVERYKTQLAAQGEPITWLDVVPPPLDPKENSASLLTRLGARLPQTGPLATNNPSGMQMVDAGRAMTAWAQPWVGDLRISNSWSEALADYETQKTTIQEFHKLIDKPNVDYNLDYSQGFSLLLPHLSVQKGCVTRLTAASICELRLRNTVEATLHLRSALAMAKGLRREPLVISQLVDIAMTAITASATWDYLQSEGLEDDQLAALQADWSQLEFFAPMESALSMERCLSLQTIQAMRESPDEFRNTVAAMATFSWGGPGTGPTAPGKGLWGTVEWIARQGWDRTRDGLAEGAWKTSWSYMDELRMLKGNEALLEVVRLAMTNGFASDSLRLSEEMKQDGRIPSSTGDYFGGSSEWSALQTMFSDGLAGLDRSFSKAVRAQVIAGLASTAIALERYRLKHGSYPSAFRELTPDYMEQVPIDPIDGNPLRYTLLSPDAYLLYSIGEDLVDDGGDASNTERYSSLFVGSGKDWVWPQPASEEEVQAHWKRELERNYSDLFQPRKEISPYTGKPFEEPSPAFYPTTGEPLVDTNSGAILVAFDRVESDEVRTNRIRALANQWTTQYFQILTNLTEPDSINRAPLSEHAGE